MFTVDVKQQNNIQQFNNECSEHDRKDSGFDIAVPGSIPGRSENLFNKVSYHFDMNEPGRVAQSVGHLTRKSGVLGSIPGLATYFRFSFRFFKKGSCQLLAKVCARSTG